MSAELIGILAVGVALAGVMVSLFAWMRADIGQLRRETQARSTGIEQRMAKLEAEVSERMGTLEQRMARLEGMLEVLQPGDRHRAPQRGGIDPTPIGRRTPATRARRARRAPDFQATGSGAPLFLHHGAMIRAMSRPERARERDER